MLSFDRNSTARRGAARRTRIDTVTRVPAEAPAADNQQARAPKVERRRQIDPTTCEREYSNDEIEFMRAMDDYKRKNGRPFPTWSEVLEVVRSLGYHRD
ncbi:MAG: hypothetical protein JSS02_21920 [Planctomycetes bacterium]|nr:hypothetical protein [Planctomycetota bacterium]